MRGRRVVAAVAVVALLLVLVIVPSASATTGGTVTLKSSAGSPAGTCASSPCSLGSITVSGTDTLGLFYLTSTDGQQYNATGMSCGVALQVKANYTIGTFGSTFAHIYLFYKAGMASGAHTCTLTYTGSSAGASLNVIGWTEAWSNVSQSSPFAQNKSATGTTETTYKVTFTSAPPAHNAIADWVQADGGAGGAYPSAGTGQTALQTTGQGAPPNAVFSSRSWKQGGTNSTMYWGESGTTIARWSLYAVDIASDFVANPAAGPPTSLPDGRYWGSAAAWVNGTFDNMTVSGNCIAMDAGKTTGSWTSNIQNLSGVLADLNMTYTGASATEYISNIKFLDQNGAVRYNADVNIWTNGGTNYSLSSITVTQWKLKLTVTSAGAGTLNICTAGVTLNPTTLQPPHGIDWGMILIFAVIFVVIIIVAFLWRYLG